MTGRYTAGPWEAGETSLVTNIYAGRMAVAAALRPYGADCMEVMEANARLIASAPDLLEALIEIRDYSGGAPSALEDEYVVERMFAAIAKASAA